MISALRWGVVMGMSQVLFSDDNGLADGRACLEDVVSEARACEVLKLSA